MFPLLSVGLNAAPMDLGFNPTFFLTVLVAGCLVPKVVRNSSCYGPCSHYRVVGLARIIVGASPTTLTLYGPVAIFVFEVIGDLPSAQCVYCNLAMSEQRRCRAEQPRYTTEQERGKNPPTFRARSTLPSPWIDLLH